MVYNHMLSTYSRDLNNKQSWVDVSKGIVICTMVIGHSSIPILLSNWIWSFHMPFFFIISALFTSWDSESILHFATRKAKVLLIPFTIYSMINLYLWSIATNEEPIIYALDVLTHGWGGVALWFLPVFFLSLIICKFATQRLLLFISFTMLGIGCYLSYKQINLPWTLSTLPFAVFLMTIVRNYQLKLRQAIQRTNNHKLLYLAAITLPCSLIISQNARLDMASNHILPILQILAGIVVGVTFIITFSIIISKSNFSKPIQSIGRNTFEIMSFSQIIIVLINHYIECSDAEKYLLLAVALVGIVQIRNGINHFLRLFYNPQP